MNYIKGKSLVTTDDYVTCPYCGDNSKRWRHLHWRHLKLAHNKTLDDVRNEFTDHPTMTESFDQDRLRGSEESSRSHNKMKDVFCIHCSCIFQAPKNTSNRQACKSCLDKGFENPDGRTKPEANVARVRTLQHKYGVDNPQKVKAFSEKASRTFKDKYGGRGFASKVLAQKTRRVISERFGAENIMQTEEGMLKFIEGLQKRYGLEITNAQQVFDIRKKTTETLKRLYKEEGHHLSGKTYIELYGEKKEKELIKQRRISGGEGFQKSLELGYSTSKPQLQLFEMIKSLFPDSQIELEKKFLNEKLGFYYHLDIAIPEIKLCIEYDTDWTHRNQAKDDFRDRVLLKFGWNTLRIRNTLPSEDELLKLLEKYI